MDQNKITKEKMQKYNKLLLKKYNTLTFSLKEKISMYSKSIYN